MSIRRSLERAYSSPVIRSTAELASAGLFSYLCAPWLDDSKTRRRQSKGTSPQKPNATVVSPATHDMNNFFIDALVQAGTCHNHKRPSQAAYGSLFHGASRRPRLSRGGTGEGVRQQRDLHTRPTVPARGAAGLATVTRDELHELVDQYGPRRKSQLQPWSPLASSRDEASFLGPEAVHNALDSAGIILSDSDWDDTYFTDNTILAAPDPEVEVAQTLDKMQQLLEEPNSRHADIFNLYKKLPDNPAKTLPPHMLKQLLLMFSTMARHRFDHSYSDRFQTILYDMRDAKIPIHLPLWNTAIRFIGLAEGVRQAVRLWREMEQHYNLRGDRYTFSILFDQATKGREFALAEMLEKEARDRHIPLDRISRMARITYAGILRDGAGVRQAYRELIDAGEIVDTAVLTNVITALIDCGEMTAAEDTFARMKLLHAQKQAGTTAPAHWRQRRKLRTILTNAGHQYRGKLDARKQFQDVAPIDPDWRTYRAFIRHHALNTADFNAIQVLLDEMRETGIGRDREIYRALFRGFARHGGIHSGWNGGRLERLWSDYIEDEWRHGRDFEVDNGMAMDLVTSFRHCVGKKRAFQVWGFIVARWPPPPDIQNFIRIGLHSNR